MFACMFFKNIFQTVNCSLRLEDKDYNYEGLVIKSSIIFPMISLSRSAFLRPHSLLTVPAQCIVVAPSPRAQLYTRVSEHCSRQAQNPCAASAPSSVITFGWEFRERRRDERSRASPLWYAPVSLRRVRGPSSSPSSSPSRAVPSCVYEGSWNPGYVRLAKRPRDLAVPGPATRPATPPRGSEVTGSAGGFCALPPGRIVITSSRGRVHGG